MFGIDIIKELVSLKKSRTYVNQPLDERSEVGILDHQKNIGVSKSQPVSTKARRGQTAHPPSKNPRNDPRFQDGLLHMTLRPETRPGDLSTWQGEMDFFIKDLAYLMENGLYWSEANVEETGGCFMPPSHQMPNMPRSMGWMFGRRYLLKDLGEDPQWRATLWIYGRDFGELSQMKLDDLSVTDVRYAQGTSTGLGVVYEYDRSQESWRNINKIFRRRPLAGWWPWPKANEMKQSGF